MSDWRSLAKCRGMDSAIFHPENVDRAGRLVWEAVAICQDCPVRDDCLAYALSAEENEGIWGGLTPRERRWLRGTRSKVCVVCEREFRYPRKQGAQPVTCSPVCAHKRLLESHRRYEETRRSPAAPDRRRRAHGKISTYIDGCRCGACRNVARSRQQLRRLAANA